MTSFIVALLCLVTGYFIYGSIVERTFGFDVSRKTPCYTSTDGVDYTPMPTWKVFLIQFLNIAGTGPIFGAIQGILFGPAAYLWIVLGCIFGGAVHDYMTGMICVRRNGESLPEIVGDELGQRFRVLMRVLAMVLLVLVGTVFATTPAGLLVKLTASWGTFCTPIFWTVVIFAYYFLATLLPIDKLIGKIYPLFGVALLVMAAGVLYGIFINAGRLPEVTEAFHNYHPGSNIPIFPGLCITIACGAVSGFHTTQSPLMARCMTNEKHGRKVFYGAMITEGLVALIWAAAAIKFADSLDIMGNTPYEKLLNILTDNGTKGVNPAIIVDMICNSWLGSFGAALAILGVVAAPITSGDTAFRSVRLIAADFLHFPQDKVYSRLMLCIPVFAISFALMFIDFSIIWRYFAWTNQTLSAFALWTITVYLARQKRNYLLSLVPALFMTMVCSTYIMIAPEGLRINGVVSYIVGTTVTAVCLAFFLRWHGKGSHVK